MTGLPATELIRWYAAHRRDLPWRTEPADPWAVLVSEVMLQQTPVRRVLPVFSEWMLRWPDPIALASDPPGEAVRAWGRLGYPRRALRLHAAASVIVADHDGRVPEDVETLLTLPGVGDYTARAVAVFAHGRREPVIDTNVRRVVNRLVLGTDDAGPATATDRRRLADVLPADPPRAARLSVALMEFGALVCTSARPACEQCPVRRHCAWWQAGRPERTVANPRQAWHGTDRQVRGRILAILRDAPGPVAMHELEPPDPADATQWDRCRRSLLADGLLEAVDDRVRLPH